MVTFQEGLGFTQKDAENLERVKDAMADLATGKGLLGTPDAAAAAAFAQLLDAETKRQEFTLRGVEKTSIAESPSVPNLVETAGTQKSPDWTSRIAQEGIYMGEPRQDEAMVPTS